MKPRLKEKFQEQVQTALQSERKYKNLHQVPTLEKIIVRMGVDATLEKSALDDAIKDMSVITGRKPIVDKSRKAVSNFKLRIGHRSKVRLAYSLFQSTQIPSWRSGRRPFHRELPMAH